MIYVGIDVAKDKHDCCILDGNGTQMFPVFTIRNSRSGFDELFERVMSVAEDMAEIKVGLEATGHYSDNLLRALIDNGLETCEINPLHSNLYRKGQSLRKTKTDRVDAYVIARMLMTDETLNPYLVKSYHNEELKSLTRYRFTMVQDRARLKTSFSRLVYILFPELESLVASLHTPTVYALLEEFPGASYIADANLTHLKKVLSDASRGRFGRDKAIEIRETARNSIGGIYPAKSMELKHTIKMIRIMTEEVDEIESSIDEIMSEIKSPITTIPGINNRMASIILAEVEDFSKFDNADRLLAYAGLTPSVYQSGQFIGSHAHMDKRGSKYLRYAIINATKYVCMWDPRFQAYLAKKRAEGKHYNVAISHAAKKLVRTIYRMQLSGMPYQPA